MKNSFNKNGAFSIASILMLILSLVRPLASQAQQPTWSCTQGSPGTCSIELGTPNDPLKNVTAVTLMVEYSGTYVDGSVCVQGSWMNAGSGCTVSVLDYPAEGLLFITLTRVNGSPVTGGGFICSLQLGGGGIIDNIDHI